MTDGTRTHDNQNHNLALYQLNYSHHFHHGLFSLKKYANEICQIVFALGGKILDMERIKILSRLKKTKNSTENLPQQP